MGLLTRKLDRQKRFAWLTTRLSQASLTTLCGPAPSKPEACSLALHILCLALVQARGLDLTRAARE